MTITNDNTCHRVPIRYAEQLGSYFKGRAVWRK